MEIEKHVTLGQNGLKLTVTKCELGNQDNENINK